MKNRLINRSISVIIFLLQFWQLAFGQKSARPNIIYIFPDQWRGSALGFQGVEPVKTPNIDKLASESVVLNNAASCFPVSIPYRGMLMTGKYPPSAGIVANQFESNADLSDDPNWISDVLKQNGYSLGYLGKWHITRTAGFYTDSLKGTAKEWVPLNKRHGFDYWYNHIGNNHMKASYWSKEDGPNEFKKVPEWTPYFDTKNAIRYIKNENGERDNNQPFALFISYNPPHMSYTDFPKVLLENYHELADTSLIYSPNIPPSTDKWGKYYRNNARGYYAMITGVDEQVGLIMKLLKEKGLDENTIVVFTSDHGDCLGRHGEISKNNHYEESFIVPFIIRWPSKLKPATNDILLNTPDIAPTLLGMAGLKKSIPACMEGNDYSDFLLKGKGKKPTSQLYVHSDEGATLESGRRGVRTERYTLVLDKDEKHALSQSPSAIPFLLFGKYQVFLTLHDHISDKFEMKNIAAENPVVVKKLIEKELIPMLKKINDPWLNSLGIATK